MHISHSPPPMLATSIVSISKEPHLSYGIMVQYGDRRWVVYKRYSEFRRLRNSLLELTAAADCACRSVYLPLSSMSFPRKRLHMFFTSDQVAIERRAALSQFLTVTLALLAHSVALCDPTTTCPILPLLKTFLQVQRHAQTHQLASPRHSSPAVFNKRMASLDPWVYTIREHAQTSDSSPPRFRGVASR
ncbi:hypothetical protein DYB37_010197 [Aphanomyces astaci]|uniref:PX domain-containing protein n=1 Tax=Aphanomyces astaci TaxID=112090 RepID=A0A397BT51_APHAT|nr:hypothetical protein DYB25_003230 [Aphanomyces astaci]RHY23288.1 hypothetical protein DYB36_012175 [Aphanomyces astaci]RHY51721.1 hypothetical protein DYB38_007300 [Aphanomyces astaci]RHY88910.1 hypothetical protein DYB35_004400 [Aphanomyces astaci]RHZ24020.1 hypothetical protein DYB37_010197 [Aphanomyces astaci]